MKRVFLILLLGMSSANSGLAGTFTQKDGAASIEIRFDGDKPKLALYDLITVTLTVEGGPSLDVYKAPLDLPAAAGWGLVERSRDSRETIAPDKVRWRLTYRFAPREPGEKVPFQFPDVAYRDGDNEYIASWQPEVFTVETRVGKSDKALRDITAIETMPPQPPADSSWPWWSVGGAGFLLLVVAVLASRFLMKRRRPRTATELALYEWDRLVAMKLPEKGRSERFITLLTLLVRRYLERQFALPARSRTTPEFVRHLEQSAVLAPEQTQFLLQFLQRSEAVKFAHEAMTADECHEWAERARDFLRHSAQTTATRLST